MEAPIPSHWLRQKGSAADFERAELERKAAAFNLPFESIAEKFGTQPFAQLTEGWNNLLAKRQEQDELWFFRSPDEAFARKLRCQGYALVQNGVIRETFVTLRA